VIPAMTPVSDLFPALHTAFSTELGAVLEPTPLRALETLAAVQEFSASPEGRTPSPAGPLDWVLVALAVGVVAVVVLLCVKHFLRPGETSEDHIKRRVLRDTVEPANSTDGEGSP